MYIMGRSAVCHMRHIKRCLLYRLRFTMLRKKIDVYKKEALGSASAKLNMDMNALLVRVN